MNASERRSQPERQAGRSVLGAPRDFANATFAKANMSKALMRTGSSFQWSAPGTGAAPQIGNEAGHEPLQVLMLPRATGDAGPLPMFPRSKDFSAAANRPGGVGEEPRRGDPRFGTLGRPAFVERHPLPRPWARPGA